MQQLGSVTLNAADARAPSAPGRPPWGPNRAEMENLQLGALGPVFDMGRFF